MRTVRFALIRSLKDGLSPRFQQPHFVRTFFPDPTAKDDPNKDKSPISEHLESVDNFEWRIFGDIPQEDSFLRKIDSIGKERSSFGSNRDIGSGRRNLNGLGGLDNSLQDGIDGKLEKAATGFRFDVGEEDGFFPRSERGLSGRKKYGMPGSSVVKENLRAKRAAKAREFETTTEEVLQKADFRNVRFLANFLSEGGIIRKRSMTGISAKAQRKVAREIKTARSFGLLPFTTMGTKSFVFGKSMEDRDEDFEFESIVGGYNMMRMDDIED